MNSKELDLWGYDGPDKRGAVSPGLDTLLRDPMGELKVTTVTHFGDFQGVGSLGMR